MRKYGATAIKMMIMAASASTLAFATPAGAAILLTTANQNLPTHIQAQGAVPGDPNSTINNALTVYGTTGLASSDVAFTGNTEIKITNGSGFALIEDSNTADSTLFNVLTMNPDLDFFAYQFSVSLETASWILVEYLTGASPDWQVAGTGADGPGGIKGVTDPFYQAANTNKDYQLTANPTESITQIRIRTCSGTVTADCTSAGGAFQYIKQNSIGLVPEPATWAMMLLGFGAIGFSMRRRQQAVLEQLA